MKRTLVCLLSLPLLLPVAGGGSDSSWLKYVQGLPFGQRLLEIKAVSTLPVAAQKDRVPALVHLLKDSDQSIRITAAAEIAEIRAVSEDALPALLDNFDQPHGEEGAEYVAAVAAFGTRALPLLEGALKSDNWLVRARACDTIRTINPSLYRDGECKERAP